ncbi:Uncharacterised protein [Mycobacteroides abscessus]|uniref:hypothetical protein n=1 Tax=Mycobacteroides abscessus TaxID=36809 RepID=UPI0005E127A5|nr:hypothetical protein [Mycobacteroides abscessus]CPU02920.1 Uncharacterised protein [Mycobacteroides abscessus]
MEFLKYGVAWVIALISIGVTVYSFKYNKRRKTLQIDATTAALLTSDVNEREGLRVELDGRTVNDPYILDFHISNIGPKDVASGDFDKEKPLSIFLDAEIVARLQPSGENEEDTFAAVNGAKDLQVLPGKIAVGERHTIRLLVDGKPNRDFNLANHPLIDTDVVAGVSKRDREFIRMLLIGAVNTLVSLIGIFAVTYLAGFNKGRASIHVNNDWWSSGVDPVVIDDPAWTHWLTRTIWIAVPILFAVAIFIIVRTRKLFARMKIFSDFFE